MKAQVRQPGNGLYELGAEINGVFVPFATLPETSVDALVQAGKANEPTPAAPPAGGGESGA